MKKHHTMEDKYGLKHLVLINKSTYSKLQDLTPETIKETDIDEYAEHTVKYYNGAGYDSKDGNPTTRESGKFLYIDTPYKTHDGVVICGWAVSYDSKNGKKGFKDLVWGTKAEFDKYLADNRITRNTPTFSIGRIFVNSEEEANQFLGELKDFIIEEDWTLGLRTSTFRYPILKTYIEHTLDRLIYEYDVLGRNKKLLFSTDGKYVAFNTNLLSRSYYNDVIVIGEVNSGKNIQDLKIYNPQIAKRGNRSYPAGFKITKEWQHIEDVIAPPLYFSEIKDVIFDATKSYVDTSNEESLDHIIKERRFRWPAQYQQASETYLAQELKKAISHAVKMAQRNYKYIVPMYYPNHNKIQFLMPLFFDENSTRPGGVLILDKEENEEYYTPKTSLTFEEAYQDARLIVKPESSWLNPAYDKD